MNRRSYRAKQMLRRENQETWREIVPVPRERCKVWREYTSFWRENRSRPYSAQNTA
ncbi:hypothetical protein [Bacillus marinisedimentorum]|uniref:hypothetical protein n=1 Tax=Bacillus marinisedimentorum TaxID=1821260 RepID=UPI001B80935F|nr:hypothetical protein [Bacillus marinisedimentorum]